MKLTGLVVAMGIFGMGPGTALLDELKASFEKKREEHDKELSDKVAPPGENQQKQQQQQQEATPNDNAHLLESTLINPSSVQRHPTKNNPISQEVTHEFVTHPFLSVNTTRMDTKTGQQQQPPPKKVDMVVPPTITPPQPSTTTTATTPTTFPWLSFMMYGNKK